MVPAGGKAALKEAVIGGKDGSQTREGYG